jgi:competence ComEA-like helix-hairpin-helix protein
MSFANKLQTIFGVSKSELTVSSIILLGLILGLILKNTNYDNENTNITSNAIYKALDSLAETQKTSYIGTDIKNNPSDEIRTTGNTTKNNVFQKKQKISSGKININTASKLELMNLPGVGESTALKILDYRSRQKFAIPQDIMNIKGIGPKKFEKMQPFIDVK